ncbi:tetratricopeptide repeat protein [Arthrobacter sp. H14-L1]|uniref:tetratricopeptide repeat protein n=1 Tax=Arthrobacter sp. H14-L1 TaxID=2996697 RepID=UPI00226D7E2C|nr:tetratricopeptide repeat protein [Arthrobacter sp. H14-L1]MCY0906427.1 tetratricopeptide repeat protein [Arthrobacter sp. H14-L1]
MNPAELAEVAVQYLDLQDASQADTSALSTVITASRGHPGRLVRFLDVPSIRAAVTGTGELPANLESLTGQGQAFQLFQALPQDMRRVLAVASLPGLVVPARWLTGTPPGILGVPPLTEVEVEAALTTGWVALDSTGMLRFTSETAHHTASRAVPAELTSDRQRQILAAIAAYVDAAHNNDSWTALLSDVCESLLNALTAEDVRRLGFDPNPAWQAELIRIRRVTGRIAAEEATLVQLEERLRTGTPSAVLVVATAEALLDAGHTQRALDVLQAELDRLSAKYGIGAAATLPALANLAAAWAVVARKHQGYPGAQELFEHAIGLYRRLLQGRVSHLPKGDVRILNTRRTVAQLLADAYRFAEAIDEARRCVQEMKSHPEYGPDHPDTLTTRRHVAYWTGEAGDAERARELFVTLLPDRVRVLGPDHPHTLAIRHNVAFWTGKAGEAERARELFVALLPDRVRVLGPDHPDTLITRGNKAYWTGEAGYAEQARELFAALLPDQESALGPDHPTTLVTRNNEAYWTGEAGDAERALELFVALLPDQERAWGPDHPDTLATRGNVASYVGKAGDAGRAQELLAVLLLDHVRVLGPDHPNTLTIRSQFAYWTDEAGARLWLLPNEDRWQGHNH